VLLEERRKEAKRLEHQLEKEREQALLERMQASSTTSGSRNSLPRSRSLRRTPVLPLRWKGSPMPQKLRLQRPRPSPTNPLSLSRRRQRPASQSLQTRDWRRGDGQRSEKTRFTDAFGLRRQPNESIGDRHRDLAFAPRRLRRKLSCTSFARSPSFIPHAIYA
jgi:hypothetical protein